MTTDPVKTTKISGLIVLVAAAMLMNYVDRGTISVAAPLMKEEFAFSATEFGLAVSAFFWIYAPAQMAVGWMCDRICVYRLFAAGMAICAISTALVGAANGLFSLIALRVILGIGESVAFPGSSKIIARHVPASRRGKANSLVAAALSLGPGAGTLVGGLIMASFGWRAMFVFFGLVTLLWLVPWQTYSRPFAMQANLIQEQHFPISRLLRLRSLWSISVGHFLGNLMLYFVLTWLPLYLVQVRGFSIANMTLLATAVFVAQAVSALFVGWLSDRLVANGRDEGQIRKQLVVIGMFGVAFSTVGIAYATNFPQLMACLIAVGVFQGFNGVNIFAIAQMFAGPRAAGTWVGVQNTIGNCAGIIGPVLTGLIIDVAGGFTSAFVFTALMGWVGALWWQLALPKIEQVDLD